jgi:cellobiose-specific phosphotransferase system component IIB
MDQLAISHKHTATKQEALIKWMDTIENISVITASHCKLVFVSPQVVFVSPQVVFVSPQVVFESPQVVFVSPQVVFVSPQVVFVSPQVGESSTVGV